MSSHRHLYWYFQDSSWGHSRASRLKDTITLLPLSLQSHGLAPLFSDFTVHENHPQNNWNPSPANSISEKHFIYSRDHRLRNQRTGDNSEAFSCLLLKRILTKWRNNVDFWGCCCVYKSLVVIFTLWLSDLCNWEREDKTHESCFF